MLPPDLQTELYTKAKERLLRSGKHIIGYQLGNSIVVYQAYKAAIADFAVKHQQLGGDSFSYERMSWIKPGFLWMMYRCGWASKADQERVIAIQISKTDFIQILSETVPTTFKPRLYESNAHWKAAMRNSDVRLQWDPDHSPLGGKLERRAIQLGLKEKTLAAFGKAYIQKIDDITDFVQEQKRILDRYGINGLQVPEESVLEINDPELAKQTGL